MSGWFRSPEAAREVHDAYRALLSQWPLPHEEHRLATRTGETFVLVCGDRSNPPLVLLHGALATSAMWMHDVPRWARKFRVYAVDVIGEPGFSAPARPPLDTDDHALWLDDVLDGLDLGAVSMVGMSLGGWLVLDYASRRPSRVTALVVLCPAGVGAQRFSVLPKVLALRLLGPWGRRRGVRLALGTPPGGVPPEAQPLMDFMGTIQRRFRGRVVRFPLFAESQLRRLVMPGLAIVGGRDAMFDSAGTRDRLTRWAPGIRTVWLPDAGHLLVDQTEPVADFLETAAAARRAAS